MKRFCTFLIGSFCLWQTAHAQQWTTKQAMFAARQTPGTAVIGSKIYVMGGTGTGGTVLTSAEVYNTANDSWTTLPSMSVERTELAAAAVNGKIYAIGGWDAGSPQNAVEEYDPSTNMWTTKSPMPTPRSVLSVAVVNNKIYAMGGWPGEYSTLEVYDPGTDTWTTKASMPAGVLQNNGATVLNGIIYIMGGRTYAGTALDEVYSYNPATDAWTSFGGGMPQPIFAGAAVVFNNQIHYLGGRTGDCQQCVTPVVNNHYTFDETNNSWTTALNMPDERGYITGAVVGNSIYILGGVDSNGDVSGKNEAYTQVIAGISNTTTVAAPASIQYSTGIITATFNATGVNNSVVMVDATGKTVYSNNHVAQATTVSTTDFASGIYIIKATSAQGTVTQKVLITR